MINHDTGILSLNTESVGGFFFWFFVARVEEILEISCHDLTFCRYILRKGFPL